MRLKKLILTAAVLALVAPTSDACGRGRLLGRRAGCGQAVPVQAMGCSTCAQQGTETAQQAGFVHVTQTRPAWDAPAVVPVGYTPIRMATPLRTCVGGLCK